MGIIAVQVFFFTPGTNDNPVQANQEPEVTVLVLLGEWFGDTWFSFEEIMERWNWEVIRAGVDTTYRGCYNKDRSVELSTELFIDDETELSQYDCLLIPSGPQFRKFDTNDAVLRFVTRAWEEGVLVASLCTGNSIVSAAGLLEGMDLEEFESGEVRQVRPGLLMGSRGGGPPPGNGAEGAPVEALCRAIAGELGIKVPGP
ncbi:DJ-1/PfpI family protein [Candidatus Zixiibacteriota bacterium]